MYNMATNSKSAKHMHCSTTYNYSVALYRRNGINSAAIGGIVTLCVLLCGMLFFLNIFPSDGFRQFVQFVAIFAMIGATVFVCVMIVWDAHTRSKKENKI